MLRKVYLVRKSDIIILDDIKWSCSIERHFLIIARLLSEMFSIHLWPELWVPRNQAELRNEMLTCPWTGLLGSLAFHTVWTTQDTPACAHGGRDRVGRLGAAGQVRRRPENVALLANIRWFIQLSWNKLTWFLPSAPFPPPSFQCFSLIFWFLVITIK